MWIGKALKFSLRILFGLIATGLAALLILIVFRIPINLNSLRPMVIEAVEHKLGRSAAIDGSVRLVLGVRPAIEIRGFKIADPEDWPADSHLVQLDLVRAQLGILALLKKEVHIDKLLAEGMQLSLVHDADRGRNFIFPRLMRTGNAASKSGARSPVITSLKGIRIRDLHVTSINPGTEKRIDLEIDEVRAMAAHGKNVTFTLRGSLQEQSCTIAVAGGTLNELLMLEKPWPFHLQAELNGVTLEIEGGLAAMTSTEPGQYQFTLDVPDCDNLEPLTGPLPAFGAARFEGTALSHPEGFDVRDFRGNLGEGEVSGQFQIDTSKNRPRIDGSLEISQLDAVALGAEKPKRNRTPRLRDKLSLAKKQKQPQPLPEDEDEDVDVDVEERKLLPFTGTLQLVIDELVNGKYPVRDLSLDMVIEDHHATSQVSVFLGETPLQGVFDLVQSDQSTQKMILDLDATDSDLGPLIRAVSGHTSFHGPLKKMHYTLTGTGPDFPAMWRQRIAHICVDGAQLIFEGREQQIPFSLATWESTSTAGSPTKMRGEGIYREEPFTFDYDRLKPEEAPRGIKPFRDITIRSAGAVITLKNEIPKDADITKPPLDLVAKGDRLGELASLLPVSPDAEFPYELTGSLSLGENGWIIRAMKGSISDSQFEGEFGRQKIDAKRAYRANLNIDSVPFERITAIFRAPKGHADTIDAAESESDAEESAPAEIDPLDKHILPHELVMGDADIDLSIGELLLREGPVHDLTLSTSIRDGRIRESPFQGVYKDATFQGELSLGFSDSKPEAAIKLSLKNGDIGSLLRDFHVSKAPDLTVKELTLDVRARGVTLGEILRKSDLSGEFIDATWVIRNEEGDGGLTLRGAQGSIRAPMGEPLQLSLHGAIGTDSPIELKVETDLLSALPEGEDAVSIAVDSELDGGSFEINSRIPFPFDSSNVDGQIKFSVDRLDRLDVFSGAKLPSLGPARLAADFRLLENGYSLSNIDALFRETKIAGNLEIDTSGNRLSLEGTLDSTYLQLHDFYEQPPTADNEESIGPARRIDVAHAKVDELFRDGGLGKFDAQLTLVADRILSGDKEFGSGSLAATLREESLSIEDARFKIAGGDILAGFSYDLTGEQIDSGLVLKMEDFHYDVPARRGAPGTRSTGKLHVDLDLKSRSPEPGEFLAHAEGDLSFALCPESFEAGMLDLWATNIVLALIPKLDPDNKSKLNCLVGVLTMEDGVLTTQDLVLDATRVRAQTLGTIDFKREMIDLQVVPRSKSPQALNLNTQIDIKGGFDDFGASVTAAAAIQSVSGASIRTALYPLRLFTDERMPEDGSDVCPCQGEAIPESP